MNEILPRNTYLENSDSTNLAPFNSEGKTGANTNQATNQPNIVANITTSPRANLLTVETPQPLLIAAPIPNRKPPSSENKLGQKAMDNWRPSTTEPNPIETQASEPLNTIAMMNIGDPFVASFTPLTIQRPVVWARYPNKKMQSKARMNSIHNPRIALILLSSFVKYSRKQES